MQTVDLEYARKRAANDSPSVLERLILFEKLPIAIFLGGLLGLSSPGFDIDWIAWFGIAPLIILAYSAFKLRDAFILGLAFGFAYELVCHRWIPELYPLTMFQLHDVLAIVAVGLLWILESLHQALIFALFALFISALPMRAGFLPYYKRPFFPLLIAAPIIWVFLQWVIAPSEMFLGLPVNQLAYTQSGNLSLIQICSIGGSQLLEFILLLSNAMLAMLFIELAPVLFPALPGRADPLSSKAGVLVDLVIVIAIVIASVSFGDWRIKRLVDLPPYLTSSDPLNYAPAIPIAVIQGNIPVRPESMKSFSKNERVERYSGLSTGLGASVLVLPEAVVPLQEAEGKLLASRLAGICMQEKKEVIVGALELLNSNLVNVVRLISSDKNNDCFYVKNRLLPLVELVPFSALSNMIPRNLFDLLPSSKNNFLEAKTPYLLRSVWGNVGASVSFEILYPELIATEVQKGASLLVNVSDLSWFHNAVLSKQLIAAAQLRAVENARYFVLASNTGISAVVNPLGVVTSSSVPGQSGNILDRVQFLHKTTQFTRMWWLWRTSNNMWWH